MQQTEENLISSLPKFKLYNVSAITIGTFLGGPLAAGYLTAENFKNLGKARSARITWAISIAFTIVMLGAILFIPEVEKIPKYLIPILYIGVTQTVVQKLQNKAIEAHMDAGGPMYSAWRAAGIGLLGLAVLFIIILLAIMAIEAAII